MFRWEITFVLWNPVDIFGPVRMNCIGVLIRSKSKLILNRIDQVHKMPIKFVHFSNKFRENNSNILFTDGYSVETLNSKKQNIAALPPVLISNIQAMVIKDQHFAHSVTYLNVLKIFGTIWIQIMFIILATTMLYFLRIGDLMRRVGLLSTYIDVLIVITGGGNLRYHNKLEKIFFGILLLGTFFINSIGIDNFLFATFLTEGPRRIDTLDKLISSNLLIFRMGVELNHSIMQNIRFVLIFIFNILHEHLFSCNICTVLVKIMELPLENGCKIAAILVRLR